MHQIAYSTKYHKCIMIYSLTRNSETLFVANSLQLLFIIVVIIFVH